LRIALISVITFVWAVNFTAPVIEHTYKPPAEINLAFMGVVGILTASFDRTKDDKPKRSRSVKKVTTNHHKGGGKHI
jgi:hypothetical protein